MLCKNNSYYYSNPKLFSKYTLAILCHIRCEIEINKLVVYMLECVLIDYRSIVIGVYWCEIKSHICIPLTDHGKWERFSKRLC